jgi:hypothetical protein
MTWTSDSQIEQYRSQVFISSPKASAITFSGTVQVYSLHSDARLNPPESMLLCSASAEPSSGQGGLRTSLYQWRISSPESEVAEQWVTLSATNSILRTTPAYKTQFQRICVAWCKDE